MAKSRKRSSAKSAGKFMIFISGCGTASQLESFPAGSDSEYIFPSLSAAKDALQYDIDEGCVESGNSIVIAQLVEVGRPTGMTWDKSFDKLVKDE